MESLPKELSNCDITHTIPMRLGELKHDETPQQYVRNFALAAKKQMLVARAKLSRFMKLDGMFRTRAGFYERDVNYLSETRDAEIFYFCWFIR